MPRQTEVAVPSRNEYHVIREIFALDLSLLENHDIGFENVEHSLDAVNIRATRVAFSI